LMFRACHHLPEPAGAIALAGLLKERSSQQGKRVAVVLTGVNMDTDMAHVVLSGGTPTT
jgi:threonine dehydratase